MECNRDEALRAKEIAERKFTDKDVVGAKKFALKAQNLFPALEGIGQMIATLDVYLASEVKVYGEKDWYAILNVNASADEDTIRKNYKKLALQLHPDKNKSVGAEGAFQLILEAWNVLSDKSRKMLYDQKRNVKGFQKKTYAYPANKNAVPNTANGLHNFAKTAVSKAQPPKSSSSTAAPTTAPPTVQRPRANAFWTSCDKCKMQYEYLRLYLNHNLLCPNCHEPFLAKELPLPANGPPNANPWPDPRQRFSNSNDNSSSRNVNGPGRNNSPFAGTGIGTGTGTSTGTGTGTGTDTAPINMQHGGNANSNSNQNFKWGAFSRTAGAASATASSSAAAQAANVVHQTYEKVRRQREEAQAAARKEEIFQRKLNATKRNVTVSGISNAGSSDNMLTKKRRGNYDDSGNDNVGVSAERCGKIDTQRPNEVSSYPFNSKISARNNNIRRDLSQMNIRRMLIDMTRLAIDRKLEEWNSAAAAKAEEKEKLKKKQKQESINQEKEKYATHKDSTDQEKLDKSDSGIKQFNSEKHLHNEQTADMADTNENIEPVSIDVPDSDFHDFDKDRSEQSFASDQIWATYDEEDGMPRYYALVQKVLSLKPFKVRMSFLSSKSNSEFGPLSWVASGFAKTCGDFRIGRYDINDTINIFSHKVRWEKGPRGVIRIVPRKGEIWALYRNWSPSWNEHTPDDIIYKYDMVEILQDYNEEEGALVTPLVKVAGFKAVFRRHMDPKEIKKIPREEMFRFSHQVPSYLLTGEEADNAPKGCHELDPAATPLELLQVITENKTSSMDAEQPINSS